MVYGCGEDHIMSRVPQVAKRGPSLTSQTPYVLHFYASPMANEAFIPDTVTYFPAQVYLTISSECQRVHNFTIT